LRGGNRKTGKKTRLPTVENWSHHQPLGSSRTQCPSTRDISSRGERPQVPWCVTMENSLCRHGYLNWIRSGTLKIRTY